MKRYIRSNKIDEYKAQLRKYGFTDEDLEQFTDEEITEIATYDEESEFSPEFKSQLYSEFSAAEADEICRLIELGYSVDNAIQTMLSRE